MPSLRSVVNHLRYTRTNWKIVASVFVLAITGVFAVGSGLQPGVNALSYYYTDGNGNPVSYDDGNNNTMPNNTVSSQQQPTTVPQTITCTCTNANTSAQQIQPQSSQVPSQQPTTWTCTNGSSTWNCQTNITPQPQQQTQPTTWTCSWANGNSAYNCQRYTAPVQNTAPAPSAQPQSQPVWSCSWSGGTSTYSCQQNNSSSTIPIAPAVSTTATTNQPASTPCPWWNDSYNCRVQSPGYGATSGTLTTTNAQAPASTPCPWWNSSYHCPKPANPVSTPCPWWNNSYHCRQAAYGTGVASGVAANPTSGTLTTPTTTAAPTSGTLSTASTSATTASQKLCSMNCQQVNAPATSGTLHPTQGVADAVIRPASTVVNTSPATKSAPTASELPVTGSVNTAVQFIGAGGLVAASAAYVSSRREMLRTVFRK